MVDEVSFGLWKVTDVIDAPIPKKATVEIVLEPGGLGLRSGGSTWALVPWPKALVRVDGRSKVVVWTGEGRVWLESSGGRSDGLAEAIAARRAVAAPVDVVRDPVVVMSYPGRTQADAAEMFARHAREMAAMGYAPVSQSWAEGRPGAARLFSLGAAASVIKPKGFLTVTYVMREAAPPARVEVVPDDTMPCPRCAETIKRAAKMCRFCQLDLTAV